MLSYTNANRQRMTSSRSDLTDLIFSSAQPQSESNLRKQLDLELGKKKKKAVKANERSDPAGKSTSKFLSKFLMFFHFPRIQLVGKLPGTGAAREQLKCFPTVPLPEI